MDFIRPSQERLVMKNTDGSVFFEEDAIKIDYMMGKAQSGLDLADTYNTEVWIGRFHSLLLETYDRDDITEQDAWVISCKSQESMQNVKKNLTQSATSVKPTESMPSS